MILKEIEVKMARATTLPILPTLVIQLLGVSENTSATTKDYERVISQDGAMAAKILRTANSPYFCGTREITSLHRALIQLGANTVRSICVTVAYQSSVATRKLDRRFDTAAYFKHSLAVACAAKVFAKLTNNPLVEEAFVAGLTHDLGKLALCAFLPDEAAKVFSMVEKENIPHFEAEETLLHVTHEEIGLLAAQRWDLPEVYHLPVGHHHDPTKAPSDQGSLCKLIHVANAMAHEIGMTFSPTGASSMVNPEVKASLGIPEEQYAGIASVVAKEVAHVASNLGV